MNRTSQDIQNELLVLEAQGGCARALERLAESWSDRLLRFAYRRTNDVDGAWDVLQESWIAIIRGIRRLEDPALFGPWYRRIIAHKSADWIRKRQAGRRVSTLGHDPPQPLNPDHSPIVALRNAMRQLPAERRELLALHYAEGLSIQSIAALLGIPEGTIKSRLHHTRHELKEIIERSKS